MKGGGRQDKRKAAADPPTRVSSENEKHSLRRRLTLWLAFRVLPAGRLRRLFFTRATLDKLARGEARRRERAARNCAKTRFRTAHDAALTAFLASDRRLCFPTPRQPPQLSVLLVLWNQAELTFACLRSLAGLGDRAEIIIVDNASTDRTPDLLARLDGCRIVLNAGNEGFLKAANQAARLARGVHLLLLNNDAFPREGAIAAALDTIEGDRTIGAVGGRIVLPDGLLQEAGCIIWRDGSCSGYGRGDPPDRPEYLFRRDVDYCSGAFLLVRRTLWDKLDGLDERFAPAYYEETDLCMRIRAAGYRVVYEPAAVVDHLEFGSATSEAWVRELRTRNRTRFLEKHADALAADHLLPSDGLLAARARPRDGRRALVIGSDRARSHRLAQGLVDEGCLVTLRLASTSAGPADEAPLPEVELLPGAGTADLTALLDARRAFYDLVVVQGQAWLTALAQVFQGDPGLLDGVRLIYDAVVDPPADAAAQGPLMPLLARIDCLIADRRQELARLVTTGSGPIILLGGVRQPCPSLRALGLEPRTGELGHGRAGFSA